MSILPNGNAVPASQILFIPSAISPPSLPRSSISKQTCLVSPGLSRGVASKTDVEEEEGGGRTLSERKVRPGEGSKSILEKKIGAGEVFWMCSSR